MRASLERWQPIRWLVLHRCSLPTEQHYLHHARDNSFLSILFLKKQSTDITNPDTRPGCFEGVRRGAGDQSWIKLICAIDTCMNRIEKKQAFFHGKNMSNTPGIPILISHKCWAKSCEWTKRTWHLWSKRSNKEAFCATIFVLLDCCRWTFLFSWKIICKQYW